MEAERVGNSGHLLQFFRNNPALGALGSVASIVALVLAVYFYIASHQTRELCYFVHPAKAVVVKAGQTSRLRITLDGAPVERDVTAAQIAFWNEGGEPIRGEHVLRPFVIRTGPQSPILEARLRKTNRDVSGITLDPAKAAAGELIINWRILERYDGGVVQLIYLGDTNAPISATATVEGQGEVRALKFTGSPEQYRRAGDLFLRSLGYLILAISVPLSIWTLYGFRDLFRRFDMRFTKWVYLGLPLLAIALSLYLVFWVNVRPGPPFGFE